MENLISRHRNVSILVAVLFAQVLGLAVQVKRTGPSQETRLIRLWTVSAVTPFEKALVWTQQSVWGTWHNYMYLRGVRAENRELKQQIEQMRIEQVRLSQDAEQARRLQLLLGFKEKFIAKTVAAQVIGSSGSEQSRSVYIDKGAADGVKTDQAVITADGIVGKVIEVFQDHTAKVLLVNDQSSGVGVVLEKSRLQGILKGTPSGELVVEKILSDESVQPGERVLTSGGDQIFPKGLDVGIVRDAAAGRDAFLNIRLKPAANLNKLEEVLVVAQVESRVPTVAEAGGRLRAADILADRLPSVPPKPVVEPTKTVPTASKPGATAAGPSSNGVATAGAIANKVAVNNPSSTPTAGSKQSMSNSGAGRTTTGGTSASPKAGSATAPPGAEAPSLAKPPVKPEKPPKQDTAQSGAANSAPVNGKPSTTEVVPTSTGTSKPSLVTKPASEAGEPSAKPANKSAAPAQTPAAPPEDPQ
ncbi:MAG TPA: rod shape-determining protein MreC [Terriglobales bacterium]|nr:rod shape-determining protein MreC [Terriglobales bacterium]